MPAGGTAEPLGFREARPTAPQPERPRDPAVPPQHTSHLPALHLSPDLSPGSRLPCHLPKGAGPSCLGRTDSHFLLMLSFPSQHLLNSEF